MTVTPRLAVPGDAIRGLRNATRVDDADAFFRAQYVASLTEYLPGKLAQ